MEHFPTSNFQLTSNQLKLIALIAMTCDHVGVILLPQAAFLRIIGRLAFPIFSFMIAEGCRYTSNRTRYLFTVFGVGILWQMIYYLIEKSFYQCILITFSLSISLIYTILWARRKGKWRWVVCAVAFLFVLFLCEGLPWRLAGTDFYIDYGFTGVLLPVFVYCVERRWEKLAASALGLVLLSMQFGDIAWYSLFALVLLACYRGNRGKQNLKYFFYIYYPIHLAVIWSISLLAKR